MKINSFVLGGWDFYQWCYVVRWHKEKYGDPANLNDARIKYQTENQEAPPTLEKFYDLELTARLIKSMLGDILGQGDIEINLSEEKEPKNGY